MEIKQLKIFLKVCEHMSFTKAAKDLNYAQSTISEHIRKLENSLDTKLFNRLNRNIFLTKNGKKLVKYSKRILEIEEETLLDIKESSTKVIRVGIIESLVSYKFPSFFRYFLKTHKDCRIIFKIARCDALIDYLRRDIVDIAYTLDEMIKEKDIDNYLLFKESLVLAIGSNIEIEKISDLNGINVIISEGYEGYNQLFYDLSETNEIKHGSFIYMESIEAIKNFVKSGFGMTFIPATAIEKELKEKSIQAVNILDESYQHNVQVLVHKDKYVDPMLKTLIDESIQRYRNL